MSKELERFDLEWVATRAGSFQKANPHPIGQYCYAVEALDMLKEQAREVEALRAALKPFAEFIFGPMWVGHGAVHMNGDCKVLCGYDGHRNMTGIDVMFSDFLNAQAALTASQGAQHAD